MIINQDVFQFSGKNLVHLQDVGIELVFENAGSDIECKPGGGVIFPAQMFVPGLRFACKTGFSKPGINLILVAITVMPENNDIYIYC